MEYSAKGIANAEKSFNHLLNQVRELGKKKDTISKKYKDKFIKAINDDLNMPKALAVIQETLKSDLPNEEKLATVLDFDKVLGLGLDKVKTEEKLPGEIARLVKDRQKAREQKNWE